MLPQGNTMGGCAVICVDTVIINYRGLLKTILFILIFTGSRNPIKTPNKNRAKIIQKIIPLTFFFEKNIYISVY
jgi:hypothetical protein